MSCFVKLGTRLDVAETRACSLTQAFAADLEQLFDNISSIDPEIMVGISSGTVSATAAAADEQMNRLVLQLASVAEKHGIRFPRVRQHCCPSHQRP